MEGILEETIAAVAGIVGEEVIELWLLKTTGARQLTRNLLAYGPYNAPLPH
jgi:hypothetical protein